MEDGNENGGNNEPSGLAGLPHELVGLIAGHLTETDAGNLALTNRQNNTRVGRADVTRNAPGLSRRHALNLIRGNLGRNPVDFVLDINRIIKLIDDYCNDRDSDFDSKMSKLNIIKRACTSFMITFDRVTERLVEEDIASLKAALHLPFANLNRSLQGLLRLVPRKYAASISGIIDDVAICSNLNPAKE